MTDLVTFGETMLRLSPPRGDRLTTADSLAVHPGGAESNVAVVGSHLGLDAVWLSKLPESPLGRRIVRELRSHGVRTGVAWADPGDSRVGTYYLERGGDPRSDEVVYDRAGSAVTTVRPDELPLGVVRSASAFHTTGISLALSERARETARRLVREAVESGTAVSFDLNYRAALWDGPERARAATEELLPAVETLFAPVRDVREVLGLSGDPVEQAHALASDYDVGTVVLTRGGRGAVALHGDETRYERPAVETDTRDPVGSGDAFAGAFLAKRLDGGSVEAALGWGAAAAGIKRTLDGDAIVTDRAEVERVAAAADTETEGR